MFNSAIISIILNNHGLHFTKNKLRKKYNKFYKKYSVYSVRIKILILIKKI